MFRSGPTAQQWNGQRNAILRALCCLGWVGMQVHSPNFALVVLVACWSGFLSHRGSQETMKFKRRWSSQYLAESFFDYSWSSETRVVFPSDFCLVAPIRISQFFHVLTTFKDESVVFFFLRCIHVFHVFLFFIQFARRKMTFDKFEPLRTASDGRNSCNSWRAPPSWVAVPCHSSVCTASRRRNRGPSCGSRIATDVGQTMS